MVEIPMGKKGGITVAAEKIHIHADSELQEFLPKYLENRKRDLEVLKSAMSSSDFKTVQVISHKIRGHALSYGFDPLSGICAKIERAAVEKNSDIIISLLNEYRDYIERVEL